MHPLAALSLPGLILVALALVPFWDRRSNDIGYYFRSAIGKRSAIVGAVSGLVLTPVLVLLDEVWVDFSAWLPEWPTLLSNGLIPLLLSFAGLAGIYYGLRRGLRANHSEATVGLFSFLFVSLVVLTIIGVVFRGPDMMLIWPY